MKNTLNIVAILAIVGTVFIWILGPSKHSRAPANEAIYPVDINASAEQRDSFALLINANQELCATVVRIVSVAEDRFEVHCKLYRDQPGLGTGERTYLINMKTGKILR